MKTATGLGLALCMCLISSSCAKQPFAEKMFGVWMPKIGVTPMSILGPIAYEFLGGNLNGGFTAMRDWMTGDVWFTLLHGQMWHVTGNQVQYCFGVEMLFEQSPFDVRNVTDDKVEICWRAGLRGMPTHTKDCEGCDCAKIELELSGDDELHFRFWMSPPVLHANIHLTRYSKGNPSMARIWSTMPYPYAQCAIRDHYGPNVPGEPDLSKGRRRAPPKMHPVDEAYARANGLSLELPNLTDYSKVKPGCVDPTTMKNDDVQLALKQAEEESGAIKEEWGKTCRQLNGLNLKLDKMVSWTDRKVGVSDVRIQYTTPSWMSCKPCDVTWEVSAATEDDEYIAFGFKGQSWEQMFPFPPETSRPSYFGMSVDEFDNFTSDRIAVGYATPSNGINFREMVAKRIIGTPVDADYKLMKDVTVARARGRTWIRFTLSQHWPHSFLHPQTDGPFRIMWAIGKVNKQGDPTYHSAHRATHPISWLGFLGSEPCWAEPFPSSEQPDIVHV